jgi:ABC-type bacteriocin/lantibiotic exporter with double-glycine peptidase domain
LGKDRILTRIIIAHRPETIRLASRVLALVDGRIMEAAATAPTANPLQQEEAVMVPLSG